MADFVIVARHFNIADGKRGDRTPMFVREFAHAAIDAGADVYVGHGWHNTLGIEIYKGKPIVYGIGNFFARSEFIRRVPYDSYESWGTTWIACRPCILPTTRCIPVWIATARPGGRQPS